MHSNDFAKLCRLCRLSVSPEEQTAFLDSLDTALSYVSQLNDVDTEGVAPCFTIHETIRSITREDTPEPPLSRDSALANAPAHTGGMFRVPPVLKPS